MLRHRLSVGFRCTFNLVLVDILHDAASKRPATKGCEICVWYTEHGTDGSVIVPEVVESDAVQPQLFPEPDKALGDLVRVEGHDKSVICPVSDQVDHFRRELHEAVAV